MSNFNWKYLRGYAIGVAAMALVGFILLASVSLDGYAVPDPGYKAPTNVSATCVDVASVSAQDKAEIEKVTGKPPIACKVEVDSWRGDALWGALAFALAAAAVFGLWRLVKSNATIAMAAFVATIVVAVLVGAWLDDPLRRWLSDNGVVMAIFWRGFISAAVVTIGGALAHEVHRRP